MFKKIFSFLLRNKKKIFYYQSLFILQGFLEAIGVVSVIPLIYAISTPNKSDLFAKVSFLEKFL